MTMTIFKFTIKLKITLWSFFACFFVFASNCYSEYSIAPGERITFEARNSADSFSSMTGVEVVATTNIIQGENFLELEEQIPGTIPVGGSGYLVYRVIEDAEDNSKMEISFSLQGTSESSWLPLSWEETVVLNYTTNTGIPTLSEWKQIFLTLLMLSLVMGFIPARSSRYNLNSGAISSIIGVNLIVLNKRLFWSVMKWIGLAVVLGLISAKAVFGHVSVLDVTGTFFVLRLLPIFCT
jgi:hypothetical protein